MHTPYKISPERGQPPYKGQSKSSLLYMHTPYKISPERGQPLYKGQSKSSLLYMHTPYKISPERGQPLYKGLGPKHVRLTVTLIYVRNCTLIQYGMRVRFVCT